MGGSSSQVTGYKYYMGMHIIICHSDPENPVEELQEIIADTRSIWDGPVVTENDLIYIDSPNVFGGDEKEGGVAGYVDIEFGGDAQLQNEYLQGQIQTNIPAFRGVMGAILNQVYLVAGAPYPKPWAFKVKRTPARNWYPEKSGINGAANIAHIVYESLTNTDWGIGLPTSQVNDENFRAAADTLFEEDFGLSLKFTQQTRTEDFITNHVLRVANGILFTDKTTGLYKITLFREDYIIDDLIVFNEDNIHKLKSYERPQPAEMVNEVVLKYRKQGATKDSTITVQDLASIQAQQGVISQTVDFTGIDNDDLAGRVAVRELKQQTTPLARVSLIVNRTGFDLDEGDVIKFSWEEFGIESMVLRILSIKLGTITSGTIEIDAIEDIFGLPDVAYIGTQESLWQNPIRAPEPALSQLSLEFTYWDIQQRFTRSDAELVSSLSCFHKFVARKPTQATPSYKFHTAAITGDFSFVSNGQWTPTAEVDVDVDYLDTVISFGLADSSVTDFTPGNYAYIGEEIIRIDSVDISTRTITVGRGCLDTVASKHIIGTLIIFAENLDAIEETEFLVGETRRGKALTQTSIDILDESLAPTESITFIGRQNKPYAPGKLRIDSLAYPENVVGLADITVSWAHRDRTIQLARPIIDESENNVGPETNVTYTLEFYNEDDVLSKTYTGLTGTSQVWDTEIADSGLGRYNESIRVKLWSVRSGEASFQEHDFSFNRVAQPINIVPPIVTVI